MLSDFRFALRQLIKSPGYAMVVVLTLAFGLAVNSTIFGMINAFFLRPLAVPEPERVVLLLQRSEAWNLPHQISFPDFQDYREQLKSIRDLYAFMPSPVNLGTAGKSPERAWFDIVTPNAFQALRVQPLMGRTLLPSDGEAAGGAQVTVLTHQCWQTRFGGDPGIVGKTVVINGKPFEVVGVTRENFNGFSAMIASSGFVSTGTIGVLRENGTQMLTQRGTSAWRVYGRLAPGATLAEAGAESAVATARLVARFPEEHRGVTSQVLPEYLARPDPIFSDYLPALTALFAGMVTLVLVIACANVANLMFARTAARQRELSMRAALGANRFHLVRQMLVESVLLALVAGTVSWMLASWGTAVLDQFSPKGDIPIAIDSTANSHDWRDIAFTGLASLLAGVASGLWPAWRASRIDLNEAIKSSPGGRVSGGRHWMRNALVVGQVAFSLVVLVSAALFFRALQRVQQIDLGFRADHLLIASFDLKLQGYDEARAGLLQQQVVDRARALPGVTAAALTTHVPFDYNSSIRGIHPENPPPTMKDGTTTVSMAHVSPGFIEMMGVRLRAGRTIAGIDTRDTPAVAVVNQRLAEICWPGQDAIGKRFRPWKDGPWIEVVGVTETAKYIMLSETPRPFYYSALAQNYSSPVTVMLRTAGEPTLHAQAVRNIVRESDPNLPVYDVRGLEELMGNSIFAYMPMRMGALLAGIQGTIGVLLAVMGLYAVVAFGVTQRTREIGIRIALGAQPADVVRAMLREGLRLTLIGLAIGLVLAGAVGFAMAQKVHGLAAVEPVVLGCVTILLVGIAAFACWWPARRATRVDPVVALRAD